MITDLAIKKGFPRNKPMPDGTVMGLRLEPSGKRGRGKWTLRIVSPLTKKRRDMGLGTYPEVGIAGARIKAMEARQLIAQGKDPIEERKAGRAVTKAMTFEQAARKVHKEQTPGWKSHKHADQWIGTLRDHAFPKIGCEPVASLSPAKIAEILRPIWLTMPETALRVKQRCQTVMGWCWAHGLVAGNPVDVVDHLLPPQPGKRERAHHQAAMPWRDIPAFVQVLHGVSSPPSTLLEFIILTAARSGEARAMTWSEVDFTEQVWAVPADRMKAKVAHRIPLSRRAYEILRGQYLKHPKLVFPSALLLVLRDVALTRLMHSQDAHSSERGRVATVHGFRSSFRDWASESGYPRDLAERALAHTIANQAEAAYHRTDLLDQRRPMMEAWADFVASGWRK